jgi:hypothetical protein
MEKEIDLNAEEDKSTYSGTFRWKLSKKLPSLPLLLNGLEEKYPIETIRDNISLEQGWKSYFLSRGQLSRPYETAGSKGKKLVEVAMQDLSLVDCLSFPLSIVHLLIEKNILNLQFDGPFIYEKLNILCMGCSYKAEERVLRETNCFQELQTLLLPFFQSIHFYFIGPEISETKENYEILSTSFRHRLQATSPRNDDENEENLPTITLNHSLYFHLFKGKTSDFIRSYPTILREELSQTIVVGYNCGFGNFDNSYSEKSHLTKMKRDLLKFRLFFDWIYDLSLLTQLFSKCPFFMFVANDYSDLKGELQILLQIFGMNCITAPAENPFSMASTLVAENNSSSSENDYSRGNSFYYAIQGIDMKRRVKLTHLKDFHLFQVNNPLKSNEENPFQAPLLKEVLPYLQNIGHYSQAMKYLIPGSMDLPKVPLITSSVAEKPITATTSRNENTLEPKEIETKQTIEDEVKPTILQEIEKTMDSASLLPETTEGEVEEDIIEIPINSRSSQKEDKEGPREERTSKTQILFDSEGEELMKVTQELSSSVFSGHENNILVVEIQSDKVNMKTIDLQLNQTTGKDLLLRFQLLGDNNRQVEETIMLLSTVKDVQKAIIKAKLSSKKKLLTVTIHF